jgi:glycosyltransferase involved in cell wall biosynthesis
MRHSSILFILKRRESYWGSNGSDFSSGLRNSVYFIIDMLLGLGISAQIVEVEDNNAIDAQVTLLHPTHCIIEAFWVVPEKFDVLRRLHPEVQWIVRNHSEIPFLANEGMAMEWISGYLARGIEVMCNSPRTLVALRALAGAMGFSERLISYGPNFYPLGNEGVRPRGQIVDGEVHVGCFGAIRPLKNHLTQAAGAVIFATAARLRLRFHINATRIEGNGEPILKNLRALFAQTSRHELVEHPWVTHEEFLTLLTRMDIVTQVSFSETFNIISADAVASGVPVIASAEVPWLGKYAHAYPVDTRSIERALWTLWNGDARTRLVAQHRDLAAYSVTTKAVWARRFGAYPE